MDYKKNFKTLIIAHVVAIVLLTILVFIAVNDKRDIMTGLLIGLGVSLAIQVLLYIIRPQLFKNKNSRYPDVS